jgi:uncharacterized protein (TIGR03067 family)
MTRSLPTCLVLAAATAAGVCGQTPAEADQMLKGTWVVHRGERDAKESPELKGAKFQFAGGKMTMTPAPTPGGTPLPPRVATYKVVAAGEKGEGFKLEFIPEDGPNKGQVMDGIFRFKDGGLDLCHCGTPRDTKPVMPAGFVTVPGSGHVLLSMKKD